MRSLKLDNLKKIAIENEDYMAAKQIKATQWEVEDRVDRINLEDGGLPEELDPQAIL